MKNKKSLLSVLLAAVLLCACIAGMLVLGASAEDGVVTVVIDSSEEEGHFATIQAAFESLATTNPTWEQGSSLVIEINKATLSEKPYSFGDSKYKSTLIFRAGSLFRTDGTRLPITIKSVYVPEGETEARTLIKPSNMAASVQNGEIFFNNDYTFENIDLCSKKVGGKFETYFAGSGNVTFKNCRFFTLEYNTGAWSPVSGAEPVETRSVKFFGDLKQSGLPNNIYNGGVFGSWNQTRFDANKGEDDLLKVGFTFENTDYFTTGSNVGSPSPQGWQCAFVAASYGEDYATTGAKAYAIDQSKIHSYITVKGDSVMTRLNGFRSNAAISGPGKVSLNVEDTATVYGVFADSGNTISYHNNTNTYIENVRDNINVEINISGNPVIKGNNGNKADSCSVSGIADSTYAEGAQVVININGGTFEEEVVAVGGHNVTTGNSEGFYNAQLNTNGTFEMNIRGGNFKNPVYGILSKNVYNCNTIKDSVTINLYTAVNNTVYGMYSDGTDSPNFTGTIDASEKGEGSEIAAGATLTVNVFGGIHTGNIYSMAGTGGVVREGGELSVILRAGTFKGEVSGVGVTLEEGAAITIYDTAKIEADSAGAGVTVTKADNWGSFDKIYLTAPANADITVQSAEGITGQGIVFAEEYTLRGWYLDAEISLILGQRVELKAIFDKATANYYKEKIGTPALAFKLGGADQGVTFDKLVEKGDNYEVIFAAAGAGDFDLALEYEFTEKSVATTTIETLAAAGAEIYKGTAEEAIFKALVDYGAAANGAADLQYFDATALDPTKLPACSAPAAGTSDIKLSQVTLLMGDTLGIRYKLSGDATGVTVKFNGEALATDLYAVNGNNVDIFVSLETLNNLMPVEILDASGNAVVAVDYAVSNIAAQIYEADNTNLKAAAVLELVLAIEAGKTVA